MLFDISNSRRVSSELERMENIYSVAIPATIKQMNSIFYLLGLWKIDDGITLRQYFYITFFVSFIWSVFLGACLADTNEDAVYLAVISLVGLVQSFRMYCIIWKQNKILYFMRKTGDTLTNDYEVFVGVDTKLKNMMTFAKALISMVFFSFVTVVFLPFAYTEKRLIFNIAFPLDYRTSESAFWFAYVIESLGFVMSSICCFFMAMVWYLMLMFVSQYKNLGSQLKNLGMVVKRNGSIAEQNGLYLQQFIEAIKAMEIIDEYVAYTV